jgi:hypothetical protein
MMTPGEPIVAETRAGVRQTEIVTRVAGAEAARSPHGIVRVGLEAEDGSLLLQLSEEAAMQLLAYLLKILPKRGLRK